MSTRQDKITKMVELLKRSQKIASELGFNNILQPGLAKEIITASILNHDVHKTKHDADAWNPNDPNEQYEYLSCWDGGSFQLDRMFKSPADKRIKSLERIKRNRSFFCCVFYRDSPLDVKTIYEVPTASILAEAERQLDVSSNDIAHVSLSISWAASRGKVVFNG